MKEKNLPDNEKIIIFEYNVFATSYDSGIIQKCQNCDTVQDIFYKKKLTISQYLNSIGNEESIFSNYFHSLGELLDFVVKLFIQDE